MNLNLVKMRPAQYFSRDYQVRHKFLKNELMQGYLLFSSLMCEVTPRRHSSCSASSFLPQGKDII